MKYLSRVVWSEGMYLGPHHFQTQSRYFEDSIRFAVDHLWFEPWGFVAYRLDDKAIRNGRVVLLRAHGIFEDGLSFAIPECDSCPAERDISGLFSPLVDSVFLFLAVSRRQDDERNCDTEGVADGTRYRAVSKTIRDINNGTDEKEIRVCAKNLQIISENELRGDLSTIPLARVERDRHGHLTFD